MEKSESDVIDILLHYRCKENPSVWTREPKRPDEIIADREDLDLGDEFARRLLEARSEVLRKFCEELFSQGANPGRVVRNLFAYVQVLFPDMLDGLKNWEHAEILFSDTRAALSARVKVIQGKLHGGKGKSKAAWRSRCERSRRVAEAARKNAILNTPWAKKKKSEKIKGKKDDKGAQSGCGRGKKDGQLTFSFFN